MFNNFLKRHKSLCFLLVAAMMLTLIITQTGCGSNGQSPVKNYQGISKTGYYLNTICSITVYGIDPESDLGSELKEMSSEEQEVKVLAIITDAFLECDRYEKLLSKTIEGSDIDKINKAGGEAVEVDPVTADVINLGIKYGDLSKGAFDITIGKASQLWNFHDLDENHQSEEELPDENKLKDAVTHVNYKNINLNGNSVIISDSETEIDLGGIAKGYISDRVAEYLKDQGVTGAVINLGGNVVALGGKTSELLTTETAEIKVGIGDPFSEVGELKAIHPCKDTVVVTSGTYERFLIKDGVKYHHVLDVNTGYPVDCDLISVTIIAPLGMGADADGLSTSCLALGMDKGMKLVKSIEGVEAIFIDNDGNVKLSSEELALEYS